MKSSNRDWMLGENQNSDQEDFSNGIAFNDHKIKFAVKYCENRDVLDLGCVQHNPENYKSKYWLHKALCEVSRHVVGMDLYEPGVVYLREKGFDVRCGNAEVFDLDRVFDAIVAGDLIEHLGNVGGFLESCRKHLNVDGKLLISTPNPWYWRNVVKATLYARVENNPEHTAWFCPVTLSQLAQRYNFMLESVDFGSRYLRDRILPLPRGLKHTSFHALLVAT